MTFALLGAAFLQGLIGSVHCATMCGPFTLILGSSSKFNQLLYNVGRTVFYATAGLLLGFSGGTLNDLLYSRLAAILGGALMLILAVTIALPSLRPRAHLPASVTRKLVSLTSTPRNAAATAILFGAISPLLPCGVLWPAFALALGTGNPVTGALVLVVFSLGTYPAMISIGLSGHSIVNAMKQPVWRITFSGVLFVVALVTIAGRENTLDFCGKLL